jgi:hypothetical protein
MSGGFDGTHGARVLAALRAAEGAAVSIGSLLQAMYGSHGGRPDSAVSVLRVTVCHLRTSLPDGQLVTIYGRAAGPKGGYRAIGYRLEVRA